MHIISLTQTQFRNYSNIHNQRNIAQTIEYSKLPLYDNYKKMYLGLTDSDRFIYAATIILIKNISPNVKEAYAPNGFLINYSDFELVKTFTEELKKYLKKEKVTYLITNPMFKYRILNKENKIIENNTNILENLYKLKFKNIGYQNEFEKYDIIIESNNFLNNIYYKFNRKTKRNIKECLNIGITLTKGSINDISDFYEIIKKKTEKTETFYYNLMNIYNSKDNKMEIFFAKLNPESFLIKIKKIYEKELNKNESIYETIRKRNGKMTEKMLNKKINSDKTLEKYKEILNLAINLTLQKKESIIVGTTAIIKNNREIYFLIDGYNEQYRNIHSTYLLKWAIIKKYSKLGYKIFNLGEINQNYFNTTNKYRGQYMYKIGFGGNIVEYPPNLLLIINNPIYNLHIKFEKIKKKFSKK